MRGQTESHSIAEATSYLDSQKDTLNKSKTIRKDRTNSNSKLTKEEKARIQKQKNREAAQRSRDIHKEYVSNLEEQVKLLRQKIEHAKRYCYRCQHILDVQQPFTQNNEEYICVDDQHTLRIQDPVVENRQNQSISQPESFLRWLEPQEDNSLMRMLLIVCMVIAVVLVVGSKHLATGNPRTLVQKYEQPAMMYGSGIDVMSPVQGCIEQPKGLVELHKEISNQQCLDSLMRYQVPSGRKSLRSVHDNVYNQEMDNIMLCSLRSPQMYGGKSVQSDSPVFKLYVSGSDIKRMVEESKAVLSLANKNIQLNGIYRLDAEIKSVELITRHSCLI